MWHFTLNKAKGNLANKIFIDIFICAPLDCLESCGHVKICEIHALDFPAAT